MLNFNEAIKKHGMPEKIYLGDIDVLKKINNDKKFRCCEKVYYPEKHKDKTGELRYGRVLIKVSFREREKQKKEQKIKKREV